MASVSPPIAVSGRLLPWWWRPDTVICRPFLPRADRLSPSVRQMVPDGLPASRTIAGRWRPRRRRFFHRRAARRRDSAIRAAGHAGGRPSYAIASTLPRTRHPLVAGSARRAEPGSRRRSRYRAFTPSAVASVGWQTRSFVARSGGAARSRCSAGGPGPRHRRPSRQPLPMISSRQPPQRTSRWPRSSRGSISSSPQLASPPTPPEPFNPTWRLAAGTPDAASI